jgi:hypothetical protein
MKVRKVLSILMILAVLLAVTGCGGAAKAENSAQMVPGAIFDSAADSDGRIHYGAEVPEEELKMESGSTTTALPEGRKLIRTIDIQAETEDLNPLLESVNSSISQLGGYVQSKNQHNGSAYSGYRTRRVSMTIRIPAELADKFVATVSANANVVSSNETLDDVTLQYVDTESQVKALETEQEQLLELLDQAKSLEDILKIQDRLTQVRYELERYASRLRTLDNQIDYATIYLYIEEVQEYTPIAEKTVWQRIADGFSDSVEDLGESLVDLFVWLIVSSPFILVYGGIAAALFLLIRTILKKKSHKKCRCKKSSTESSDTQTE